jgi:transcription-repair coupling factor (superfamily II helicase)
VFDEDTRWARSSLRYAAHAAFHGSIPAFIEQIRNLMSRRSSASCCCRSEPAEVERLATVLREYQLPYRLGSRNPHVGSENLYDETSHLAGDMRVPVIVRAQIASASACPSRTSFSSARTIFRTMPMWRAPEPRKSKTAAFVSDFRDLTIGDYVVHVEHGIGRYVGSRRLSRTA